MKSTNALSGNGMRLPFFSVIIPMYNVGGLVRDCLQSVYMQDMAEDELEVIVVNDNSNDDSAIHASEVSEGHPNTTIISHHENKRPGGARNTALRIAKGEYVVFLDADDYWRYTNTLSAIKHVIEATGADVIDNNITSHVDYTSTLSPQRYEPAVEYKRITCEDLLRRKDFQLSPWNAAYRRDAILEHEVWFGECVQYEDVDWRMRMIYWAGTIVRISFPYYCYRKNPQSILNNPSPRLMHDAIACYKRLYAFASGDISQDMKRYLCTWIVNNVTSFPMLSRIYPLRESRKAVTALAEAGLLSRGAYMSVCPGFMASRRQVISLWILKCMPCLLLLPYRMAMLGKNIIRRRR